MNCINPVRAVLCLALLMLPGAPLRAEEHHSFNSGQALRDYCQREFQHPQLWETLMRYNGFQSLGEIPARYRMKVPTADIRRYHQLDAAIRKQLSTVVARGARVFTEAALREAVILNDTAREAFREGQLAHALLVKNTVIARLTEIENICLTKQHLKIQAKVFDLRGRVNRQPRSVIRWEAVSKDDDLYEEDKIRTLADAYTDIVFKDESHLKLYENSLTVIEKMRTNQLTGEQQTAVILVRGSMNTVLTSLDKTFDLGVGNVTTDVRSTRFWTSANDAGETRIANFDGEIGVAAEGEQVMLEKNQGTKVISEQPPLPPKALLPEPAQLAAVARSGDGHQFDISWQPVHDAQFYRVEISPDFNFFRDSDLLDNIRRPAARYQFPAPGIYYVRVTAVDDDAFPGPASRPLPVVVRQDDNAPFLYVKETPRESGADSLDLLVVKEKNSSLYLNDQLLPMTSDTVLIALPLGEGLNQWRVRAMNEQQHASEQHGEFLHLSDPALRERVAVDCPPFVNHSPFLLKMMLPAGAMVVIDDQPYYPKTGEFTRMLSLSPGQNDVSLEVRYQSRSIFSSRLTVTLDQQAPQFTITGVRRSGADSLVVAGEISEPAIIWLDDREVAHENLRFRVHLDARTTGSSIRLRLQDRAGNTRSGYVNISRRLNIDE